MGLDIWDPTDNVHIMLEIMTAHLRECGGYIQKALQKYNSGETAGRDYSDRVFNNLEWIEKEIAP